MPLTSILLAILIIKGSAADCRAPAAGEVHLGRARWGIPPPRGPSGGGGVPLPSQTVFHRSWPALEAGGVCPSLAVIPGGPPHPLDCPAVRARFAAVLETVRDTRGPGRSWVTAAGAGSRRNPLYRCAVQRQGCSRELRERRWEPAAGLGEHGFLHGGAVCEQFHNMTQQAHRSRHPGAPAP